MLCNLILARIYQIYIFGKARRDGISSKPSVSTLLFLVSTFRFFGTKSIPHSRDAMRVEDVDFEETWIRSICRSHSFWGTLRHAPTISR